MVGTPIAVGTSYALYQRGTSFMTYEAVSD